MSFDLDSELLRIAELARESVLELERLKPGTPARNNIALQSEVRKLVLRGCEAGRAKGYGR